MVKVIGEAPGAIKECTCRNCASRLQYTDNDTQEYRGKDYSGGPAGKVWIVCPKCGNEVIVRSW